MSRAILLRALLPCARHDYGPAAPACVIGSVLYSIRRISGTIIVPMVLHALWDLGSFSHIAGKATGVAGKVDLTGMSLLQNLVLFVVVILIIIGATRILGTKKRAVRGRARVRCPASQPQ